LAVGPKHKKRNKKLKTVYGGPKKKKSWKPGLTLQNQAKTWRRKRKGNSSSRKE